MRIAGIRKNARGVESLLAFFTIFLLALFPLMEVIARKFFHTGVRNSTEITHHLVLMLAFIAAAITSRENRHLSLTLNLKFKPGTFSRVRVLNAVISTAFATAFTWCAFSFLLNAFDPADTLWVIPKRWIAMVMPVGYGIMAYRFVRQAPGEKWGRAIASSGFLFGTLLAWEAAANSASVLLPAAANRIPGPDAGLRLDRRPPLDADHPAASLRSRQRPAHLHRFGRHRPHAVRPCRPTAGSGRQRGPIPC